MSNIDNLDLTDQNTRQWLQALDKEPQALIDFLTDHPSDRLGIYFELLLRFYFQQSSRFELKAYNLQLNQDKRTIGELDFVVIDNTTGIAWHIETAVKWYLERHYCLIDGPPLAEHSKTTEWCHWIGPNDRDCLAKKMVSLVSKQLRMAETNEAKALLANLGIDKVRSSLWFKGYLFAESDESFCATGNSSNKNIIENINRHQWLSVHQLERITHNKPDGYAIVLPKLFWLNKLLNDDYQALELHRLEHLVEHLQSLWQNTRYTQHKQALLVAFIDDQYQEYKRYFIDYQ